jgi:hypothetical protein
MALTITRLTQRDADALMKSLDTNEAYYHNFYGAFHDERRQTIDRNIFWALSEEERSYYLIESYLFGINFQNPTLISISSFARILNASPSQNCATCLKFLLQDVLFPICVAHNKNRVNAALTEKGRAVFEKLKEDLPGIEITLSQPYHFATMTCEGSHS